MLAAPKPLLMIQAEVIRDILPEFCAAFGEATDLILAGLGVDDRPVKTVTVCRDAPLPAVGQVSAVVITGSVSMVADPDPWIARTAAFVAEAVAANLPVLGICFGHQLIAHATGGHVGPIAGPPEYATVEVRPTAAAAGDPVMGHLPGRFLAQGAHHQGVLTPPPGAVILAEGDAGVQAMRIGNAWGLQFHPEFTPAGMAMILERGRASLASHGVDVDANLAGLAETPEAASVLGRFGGLVRAG